VTVSRRTLLTTLGLMLPAVAAEAATPHKPRHTVHKVAKAAPHKPAKAHKLARRHHAPAKPPIKHS
jgi:hypothetical protein